MQNNKLQKPKQNNIQQNIQNENENKTTQEKKTLYHLVTKHFNANKCIKKNSAPQTLYNTLRDQGLQQRQIMTLSQIDDFLKKHEYTKIQPDWDSSNGWLSNIEIQGVLSQVTPKKYRFLGVFSSDFDKKTGSQCIFEEICEIDYRQILEDGDENFGIVFNLSRFGERGTHWVSVYGSLCSQRKDTINIFYYDSNGQKSKGDIKRFIQKMIVPLQQKNDKNDKKKVNINVIENHIVHQKYSNSECGMFCIFFIISMLMKNCHCGGCYEDFLKSKITDLDVFPLRWVLFDLKDKYCFDYKNLSSTGAL